MNFTLRSLLFAAIITLITACNSGPEPLYDLSKDTYQLRNSDSTLVNFPGDYKGEISVVSFIYTHCPDVCPVITANLTNIQKKLTDTTDLQFIEISFDPQRDTPSVLANYKDLYKLNDQFTLLTGETTLLDKLEIKAKKTYADSVNQDSSKYLMKHSNKIYLMDKEGKIRYEYPASVVPLKNVIEDIKKMRTQ